MNTIEIRGRAMTFVQPAFQVSQSEGQKLGNIPWDELCKRFSDIDY